MTRGRQRNTAWIGDPTGTLDPAATFAQAVARPSNALTAHATRRHLHRLRHQPLERPPAGLEQARSVGGLER